MGAYFTGTGYHYFHSELGFIELTMAEYMASESIPHRCMSSAIDQWGTNLSGTPIL